MLLTDLQGLIWRTGDQCENTVRILRLEGYLDYSTRTSELQKEKEVVIEKPTRKTLHPFQIQSFMNLPPKKLSTTVKTCLLFYFTFEQFLLVFQEPFAKEAAFKYLTGLTEVCPTISAPLLIPCVRRAKKFNT